MEQKPLAAGDSVKFFDEHCREHEALVTCVHSEKCINLVYVSKDEKKSDVYGQQIERMTSVCDVSLNPHGNYFSRLKY
jgi:hypothetical protein